MKKILALSTSGLFILLGSLFINVNKIEAQYCTGSATCESNCTIIRTPSGCKTTCAPDDPSCQECSGSKRVCDTTQISCGFDNVWNGTCAADCSSVGGNLTGASCNYVPPPPPPPPPPATRYGCSGSSCDVNSGGAYTTSNCNGACTGSTEPTPPPGLKYSCSGTTCAVNAAGPYAENTCGGTCAPPPTAVPPPSCEPEHKYKVATIWLRVISQGDSGETIAWKGPESNNPIFSTAGWSVAAPTTDSNGNQIFGQYKSYDQGSVKTFNTTLNKIGQNMDVKLAVANPGSHDTIEDACGTERTVNVPNSLPHGENWSNHFCSGGLAYAQSGVLPAKTNSYCQADLSGPIYWKEDTSGEYGGLDCDGDPRAWAAKDRDGCDGGFMRYGGQSFWPPSEGVYGSMHDSLVPILAFANPLHWADLSYDGYWSMQFQAWDEYDSYNGVSTSITITPPTGQTCKEARWFNKLGNEVKEQYPIVQSVVNGDCEIIFNPKSDGNVLIVELTEPVVQESCTIELEDYVNNPNVLSSNLTIDKYSEFTAHFSGLSSEPTPPNKEEFKLWLARDDFAAFTPPASFTQQYDATNNRYYYRYDNSTGLDQQCFTNAESPCYVSAPIYNLNSFLGVPTLPEGTYNLFCDERAGTDKCSGNVACSMNNNGVGAACTGFADCSDDTLGLPTDHATVTVTCTPQCTNTCASTSYPDGCGGTCPAGAQFGNPGTVTISDPFSTKSITSSAPNYPYDVTWSVSEAVKTDYFDVLTYPQGAYADAVAAETAYYAGATDVYYKQVTAVIGQSSYTTSVNTLSTQGWKITLGVKARNISCGDNYSIGTINYDLIGSISGAIKAVTSNICSGGTVITNGIYPDVQNGTTVTTSDDSDLIPNFSIQTANKGFGVYGSIVNGYYSVSFLPFDPPMWHTPGVLTTRLNIQNPDLSQAYVCAVCNRESIFTCRAGGLSGTSNVSATNKDFYVQLYNLANDAWWQVWGGNAYGKQGLVSAVPASCTTAANCKQNIIADISGAQVNSAGVPMSNSTISNTGGYYSENDIEPTNGSVGNPRGQSTSLNFAPVLENYEYFLSNADVAAPATATNPGSNLVINSDVENATQFKAAFGSNYKEINGEIVAWVDNSLTVDLNTTTANWNVPAGQKWVVFVPGDITFTGPTTHTQAAQQYLIKVQTGGFLAFIAKGDITFNEDLGYDDATNLALYQTPIVEGMFIASDTLIVKSKGGSTPSDYKFVAAGTFVGWTGVNLERDFDNGGTRKSLHNNSPTELFIYRPEFMTNSPEFLKKSTINWKEVN